MTPDPAPPPFAGVPSGLDIMHWFSHSAGRSFASLQSAEGYDLYRSASGKGYCYVWVEVFVDHDMESFFLLDVRTCDDGGMETRDHLFVVMGVDGLSCEWQNEPIRFDAPTEAHRERGLDSMIWLAERIADHYERETPI